MQRIGDYAILPGLDLMLVHRLLFPCVTMCLDIKATGEKISLISVIKVITSLDDRLVEMEMWMKCDPITCRGLLNIQIYCPFDIELSLPYTIPRS